MFLVGLTGGIGTGKSTTSAMFRELGVPVIDADVAARKVVEPGKKAWKEIRRVFGEDVFEADGQLNRRKLGDVIFGDPLKRKQLNSITHPQIAKQIACEILMCFLKGYQFVIIDSPLLFEANTWLRFVHRTIVVSCDASLQLERLMSRDKLNESESTSRIQAQMPIEEKCRRADFIIENSGSISNTKLQVKDIYDKLRNSKAHWRVRIPVIAFVLISSYLLINSFIS